MRLIITWMLFTLDELRLFDLKVDGVLHIGAHLAEESQQYEELNWSPLIWIEANPYLVKKLKKKFSYPEHKVIEACISDRERMTSFFIANNSQSSSYLSLKLHSKFYKNIKYIKEIKVKTRRIDSIISSKEMPNFINIDIQGTELKAIKSMGVLLQRVDYIYTEVYKKELYNGCSLVREVDSYLKSRGFKRTATRFYLRQGWGDALYIRESAKKSLSLSKSALFLFLQFKFYAFQFIRDAIGLRASILRKIGGSISKIFNNYPSKSF